LPLGETPDFKVNGEALIRGFTGFGITMTAMAGTPSAAEAEAGVQFDAATLTQATRQSNSRRWHPLPPVARSTIPNSVAGVVQR